MWESFIALESNRLRVFLFVYFLFQLANLPVEPDEVGNNAREHSGNDRYHYPYFAVGPEPVGHFYTIRNGLLSQEVLTEQE
jgi:hypothetical protein